ncbi:Sec-independent protein translocase subunit TatA [Pseudonocardia sp. HH130630-07]|uniref:Sec-independent protein translocase subunit TatA n=1 Tax=Pseudonocardia sp. HH130630-07 TaxID=1690815 RepID=UPI00081503D9|nr:Sec-independent protein translocase subunit TatA [Pseudonocardia sp. HH130630-07]ANY09132.1 preprotein translocase subunit TatA [Pseudonocardia sp. HH130630-07]
MPGGYEWLIIIAVVLLLFGAKKLPEMARSIGQSARVFKGEMKGLKDDESRSAKDPAPEAQAPQELPSATPAPQAQAERTPSQQPQDRGTLN